MSSFEQYDQYRHHEQPQPLASWSAPSSASSHLGNATATTSASAGSQGPPPDRLPRLDSIGSTHGSGSHLLPAGLMEQQGASGGGMIETKTSTTGTATRTTSTGAADDNENSDSHPHHSYISHIKTASTNGSSSSDVLGQLNRSQAQVASLQSQLRKAESQIEYLTQCCTEAGTELAKSHHEHTQTKKELRELAVQEKKSSVLAENARTSLRNVMAENVELREEVVRLRELLGRQSAAGMGMDGGVHAHLGGHGNHPIYDQPPQGGFGLDHHSHHQHQPGNSSVRGITSGLSGISQYSSTTPPPGTAPASSTASGTASGNSSLASPLESYQLTGSGSYPGKDSGTVGSVNKLLAAPNQLPSLPYTGSLGTASGGGGGGPLSYDMMDYNTAGLPSETAARALEREAAGPPGGRGTRGGRAPGRGGRGRYRGGRRN